MTKKKPLVNELQRRAYELFDILNAAGDSDAVIRAKGEVVNQLMTVVSPLAVEIEAESAIKRDAASGPRKAITEEQLLEALKAHIVRCRITGRHAASKGWKGAIAHTLEMDPRTLRWPPDWDEARIINYLESR